jgi:hypothetical protein
MHARQVLRLLRWICACALLGACDRWLTKPSLYNNINVVVSARDGSPVPGANLTLFTGQRAMGFAVTGRDGRYTFERVPRGEYGIAANPPEGYALLESLVDTAHTNVVSRLRVADDTVSPVHFTFLKSGPGVIIVRTAQNNGGPAAGVPVLLYDPTAVRARAVTDASGRATFDAVPFGVYGVALDRNVFFSDFPTRTDGSFATFDNLIVDAGSRDSVTFTLQRCSGTLRALAVDQNNLPVRNASLTFYTASQIITSRLTDADGRASAEMPCSVQTGVSASPAPTYTLPVGRGFSFFDGFTFTNGQTADVTFRLQKTP